MFGSLKNKVGKEIPIILFFIYLAYLSVIFHNRDHIMLDYTLTFDLWWYFYHRLREGSIAQWNPFSLLGSIAVQWNNIPVSMFSPFLILSDLTLEGFHNYQIIGTFMAISVIYLIGRILGYGRFYPLLPVVLFAASGYRYWASFLHFSTFLFFYPLAIVSLLLAVYKDKSSAGIKWLIFFMLLSFSFTGLRLEKITYGISFILLIFFILGIYQYRDWKKMLSYWGLGLAAVLTAIAANAWQLSFLISSTIDNSRVSPGFNINKIFDPVLIKWVGISIIYQPVFILLCFNLILLWICYLNASASSKRVSLKAAFILIGIELAIYKVILTIRSLVIVKGFIISEVNDVDIVFSIFGIISIIFLVFTYFLLEKEHLTIGRLFKFFTVLFSGFYISEYSWHVWPVNQNLHPFFMPVIFSSFIPLGAVHLMNKGKTWIVTVLVIYHFIGETVSFFLFEVIGMPWLVPRAALMEAAFQVILILEAAAFFVYGMSHITGRLYNKIDFSVIESKFSLAAKFACLVFAFLTIKMFLMPVGFRIIDNAKIPDEHTININMENTSFETWVTTPNGDFLPAGFSYHSDNISGVIEKNILEEGLKGGKASALLKPPVDGSSFLRYRTTNIEDIRGEYIIFSVWVKSKNTVPNSIKFDIQDGIGNTIFKTYTRSGEWEHIELLKEVNRHAKFLTWTCYVEHTAADKVYLDDITFRMLPNGFRTKVPHYKVYIEDFPFAEQRIDEIHGSGNGNKWIYEAYENAVFMRSKYQWKQDPFKRIHVDDSTISLLSNMLYYKFIPAYSQTHNTATVY